MPTPRSPGRGQALDPALPDKQGTPSSWKGDVRAPLAPTELARLIRAGSEQTTGGAHGPGHTSCWTGEDTSSYEQGP